MIEMHKINFNLNLKPISGFYGKFESMIEMRAMIEIHEISLNFNVKSISDFRGKIYSL